MLRTIVAQKLRANLALNGAFVGGIYPLTDADPSIMDPSLYPAAWADTGEMLPTILVQDSSVVPLGPLPHSAMATIRVLYWQQRGRDLINQGMRQTFATLNGSGGSPAGLSVYRYKFAGFGPDLRDPSLRDAEHGWSTWQAELLVGGS